MLAVSEDLLSRKFLLSEKKCWVVLREKESEEDVLSEMFY